MVPSRVKERIGAMERPLDMGLLKSGLLFRNMTDGEVQDVLEAMHARRQVFPSKAVVVRDGDPMSEIGILLSGGLHLSHVDASGNSNLMDALGPGDAIGLLNAIGRYRLHISAVATEKTELLFFYGRRAAPAKPADRSRTDPFSAKPDGGGGTAGPAPDP